ncbi:MAG: RNA polymerase sigma factor [Saccharofermentanales bacterium]
MQKDELEKQIDFLHSVALHKCGNLEDAKDLTQETLLSALVYLSSGNEIDNLKAWLVCVLNRKFYDMMRRKYKIPTVCYDLVSETADNRDDFSVIFESEEAEEIRQQIAFLSKLYREVIVRHYMNGESVEKIASKLDIPVGTVKSRLSSGRDHIKKGIDFMDKFAKQSYEPDTLYVSNSGSSGLNGEPRSITDENPIVQNLLILAYEKPLTEYELSKAIGIPTAYIEPTVKMLVNAQLMKRIGKKVYTDFIIFKPEDTQMHIPAEKKLIENNFTELWKPIGQGIEKLKNSKMYRTLNLHQRVKLEYYFLIHCLEYGFYNAGAKIYDGHQNFPDRPNGGKWIAFGSFYPHNYDSNKSETQKYSWAGERRDCWQNSLGAKEICLHVYDTPFELKRYYNLKYNMNDADLAQMLYIIHEGLNPNNTGINVLFYENLPYLAECGVVRFDADKAEVDIPVLTNEEFNELSKITNEVVDKFVSVIYPFLKEHLRNAKTPIPKHLTSVPEQKQYMMAMGFHMLMVYNAKDRNLILQRVDYPCPPMVLVIDK